MKYNIIFFAFFVFLLGNKSVDAQIVIRQNYFQSPLGIPLEVTGSFAEIRSNHFHSGIDFPVQQREGLPVVAVDDGFVSRVKVSPIGFGKAIYIDHPNGFTSVYAHLLSFNDTINAYVYDNQYNEKRFDVDLFPANTKLYYYVKKGQLIGYAGNSGSSGGPHLHFELRNTRTERIINPDLFEFGIIDKYPPYFDFIKIFPETDYSFIGSSSEATRFNVKKTNSKTFKIAIKDTLTLWGEFSFAVQAFDYHHNLSNRNGWYSIKMKKDESVFFSMVCDSFSFDESRYINACIDFADNYNAGSRAIKSKKLPGNKVSFYKNMTSDGIVRFMDNALHTITVEVGDLSGNVSTLKFFVLAQQPQGYIQVPAVPLSDSSSRFLYNKVNRFESKDIKVEIPIFALYEDIDFKYVKKAGDKSLFSAIHQLHTPEVPLHTKLKISIKADLLPAPLRNKALLVRVDRAGKKFPAGGEYVDGFVVGTSNLFDGYAIGVDTIAPTIINNSGAKPLKRLKFTVSDNFSGIRSYKGELNGKWVLVEWDPKNKLMVYNFDKNLQDGANTFVLYLEDSTGNKSSLKVSFTKPN